MAINETTLIVEKMNRMATLLELGGYAKWSVSIFKLADQYEPDPDYTKHIFLNFYGGMGSLNDLVLYRNGSVLMSENDWGRTHWRVPPGPPRASCGDDRHRDVWQICR